MWRHANNKSMNTPTNSEALPPTHGSPSSILDGISVVKTPHHGFEWRFPTKGLSQSMSMGEVMLWSILQELKHPMMVIEAEAPHNRPCQKCGGSDIYRKWRSAKEKWHNTEKREYRNEFVMAEWLTVTAQKECITHHCRCCGWQWETDILPENASAMAPPPQRLPSTKDVPGG